MKIYWLCRILGHKFIQQQDYNREDRVSMRRKFPVEYCTRCGLSKDELNLRSK